MGPIALASFGLVLNLLLWGIPGMVAASSAARAVMPGNSPTMARALGALDSSAGSTPSAYEALVQLIGAESQALQVAGEALQQPTPTDIARRATATGVLVQDAIRAYIQAAHALVQR